MRYTWVIAAICLLAAPAAGQRAAAVDARDVPTGILYDRVVPMSRAIEYDGRDAPAITPSQWLQVYHEFHRATIEPTTAPEAAALRARANRQSPFAPVALAVLHARYNLIRDDAGAGAVTMEDGRLRVDPSALREAEVFAVAPVVPRTYRGSEVSFVIDRSWVFTPNAPAPAAIDVDPGDGAGFRRVQFGEPVAPAYAAPGEKTIRVRATFPDGRILESASVFRVESMATPLPNDTITITSTLQYNGAPGTAEAYVYLAPGHGTIVQPAIVLEGFDIDNNMNWDELYALLNDENLIEDVRASGYDIVVLNFDDAKDYIQRNAFATIELLGQVDAIIAPTTTYALLGASMGGLCARYALCYMEDHSLPHRVRTYVSFDTPHKGANIPLGIQYWLDFFSASSAEAAALLASLDTPAALQMLAYHYVSPPSSSPGADPLRAAFLSELSALGSYPATTRNVAMSNGSSTMVNQGFSAGAQIIEWEHNSFIVDVRGNVWAVPDGSNTQILQGLIDPIIGSTQQLNVSVSGTDPWDNAPGGWRSSMAQMDAVEAPYGDIVAVYDNHCFIPTISALDLTTDDLFYDVAGEPDILAMTAFDAVYFPAANQPHVDITPENKQWILDEVFSTPTAARPAAAPVVRLDNVPNPFNPTTTIRYTLSTAGDVSLRVYDVRGALVATLLDGVRPAGPGTTVWNGHADTGGAVSSGIYFVRLETPGRSIARKMVLVK